MAQTTDFIPKFRPRFPEKFSDGKWLDFDEPQVILVQGSRGSGKGVAVDAIAEKLYKEGHLILHIWGARSFENVYWAINKNCGKHYQKMKKLLEGFTVEKTTMKQWAKQNGFSDDEREYYLQLMINSGLITISGEKKYSIAESGFEWLKGFSLHCKCNKAYPILWIVPDYIDIDQESLDRFNGGYWKDFEEYSRCLKEITPEEKELLNQGKLKKPECFQPEPLIKVRQITIPTSQQRKEVFRVQFTEIVIDARKEHRVVVMNPAIYEGSSDKFEVFTEIFRMIPFLMNKSGHFTPLTESDVGKARKYWTKKQKSWHKVSIIINELRSVAPSSKMHGEKSVSPSKKAIFDYIPEARHYKTWFVGDYQNPEDLYAGVRYQANLTIIKQASRNILGDKWTWLFDKMLKKTNAFHLCKTQKGSCFIRTVGFLQKKVSEIETIYD